MRCQNIQTNSENILLRGEGGPQVSLPKQQIIQLSWWLVRVISNFFYCLPLLYWNKIVAYGWLSPILTCNSRTIHWVAVMWRIHFNIFSTWWFEELWIYWLCMEPIACKMKSYLLQLISKDSLMPNDYIVQLYYRITSNRNELNLVKVINGGRGIRIEKCLME